MKKSKTFTIGDIHGGYKALKQCIDRSKIDYKKDKLIVLGDVVDGWSQTPECIEELLKFKNLVYVIGNHDVWTRSWFNCGERPTIWTQQGGNKTIRAYIKNPGLMVKHREFFNDKKPYYKDDKGRLFVHGGFDPNKPIEEQRERYLTWDRDLWDLRHNGIMDNYKGNTVFVGHTSIWRFSHNPLKVNNVWFLDTGGGWEGKLTIMNVDTEEWWQSDKVIELYTRERGRA